MTAASNERKRFLSWPRPVCQEPFTRTFAAAPMFHAIWIIIYPVTTSRARRDCRTPSQKPREKKRTRTSSLALARLSANRAKVTQICADSSKRWEDFELLFRIVPPLFLLDLLYYCSFSFFFFFFFCVCVCFCCIVLVFVERYSLEWTDSGEKCERIVRIYDIRIIEADGLVSLIAA